MIIVDKVNFPINLVRRILEFSEVAFVVIYLILYAAGIVVVILMGGASEDGETSALSFDYSLNRLLFFVNYIVTVLLLALRWKQTLYTATSNFSVWILILLAPISTVWSVEPSKTLSASIAMIGTCLFALYLASNYSPRQQLQLLGWSFAISILLSFVFAIALRKYGIMGGVHAGAWRGIYTHKNWLGRMMVLAAGMLLILANDARQHRWVVWAGFSLSFLLVLLSKSSSSLLNALTVVAVVLASRAFRLHTKLLVPVLLSAVAFGTLISLGATALAEIVVGSLGKNLTLTGRSDIWPLAIEKIQQRPFLGYGFAAFWNGLQGESASIIRALQWPVPNSHNGFIDLGVDFGLIGLFVFGFTFLQTLIRSLIWVRIDRSWISLSSLLLLVFLVLSNVSETALYDRNSLVWVLYIALIFNLSLEMKEFRERAYFDSTHLYDSELRV